MTATTQTHPDTIEVTEAGIAALAEFERAISATHPAILKAQELYDREGDLDANEETLVSEVNRINRRKSIAYGAAQTVYGDIPKQYRACLIIADEKARNELDRAMTAYEQGLEFQDELEEVELAMAAE